MYNFLYKHLTKGTRPTVINKMMTCAAVIHPLMAMPQVIQIYTTQNVEGVSVWTWLGFMMLGFVFLCYGIVHRLKPFIITQILWFFVDFLVVLGVLLFR